MKRLFALLICAMLAVPFHAKALTDPNQYVRTANYFLMSGPKLDEPETIRVLSSFDLLVLPAEAQVYNRTFFQTVRANNPDIIILAYVPTVSWNHVYWSDPLHQRMLAGIQGNWWLKDALGITKSVWPNTSALNLTSGWATYLAEFTATEILATGLWDGIFYDEVQDSISWVGGIDTDSDGRNDTSSQADARWALAYENLLSTTRRLMGDQKILITNGSSNASFAPHVNGRMYENFPSSEKKLVTWHTSARDYLSQMERVTRPDVTIVNVTTNNTGVKNDYQRVRYGITTTLLGNGYFGFDFGDSNHGQLWTYDEYNARLGKPIGTPKNTLTGSTGTIAPGLLERDFAQGKIFVNATDERKTLRLNGEYEKLRGTQDRTVNNGAIVSQLTLEAKDGIILLRPIETLEGAVFVNGAFARVFGTDGRAKRNGFFAYETTERGGERVVRADLDRDGVKEIISAGKTFVMIKNADGTVRAKFAPYSERYTLGINLGIGDLENDGRVEIVTGTEKGGGPQVRIFNHEGVLIHPGFFAYDKAFRGGVRVAIGDLNGDAVDEIIAGAGPGGGPHVRVFHKDGHALQPGFFAYDKAFRGGVSVAVGDVNGDGMDEVITGPGKGGGPHVRIFDRNGNIKWQFFVEGAPRADGMQVAAVDLDSDRTAEIIALSSDVFTISF